MVHAPSLPALPHSPQVVLRERLRERDTDGLDALLAIVPLEAPGPQLSVLPYPERWRGLHSQSRPSAGTVRSTSLPNARQTRAVLGYLRAPSSAFERLTLAGRMLKEIAAGEPEGVALAAPGDAPALEALLAGALAQACTLPQFRRATPRPRTLRRLLVLGGGELDVTRIQTVARANNLTRFLTALPPNVLDARAYRRLITQQARAHRLQMRWLDEATLRRLGANAFLAVSAGNAQRTAGIAHLRYRPPRRHSATPDVALIGKGILFDTGGTNLKPHRSMLDMHIDMSGSAVALSTLLALAQLRAPIAAEAWLAITENRIGPSAYVPQDVVRAANGVTIQVIHTDAEGRMVLADTLALAARRKPRLMLDFGTLTGACVYALTERMSGVFTNEPRLTELLVSAGRTSGERVWPFPFDADYDSDLESRVADIMQCAPEGKGDHILAARFLSRFVPQGTAWVHVDLAAALRTGGLAHINTDITGFGARYALELLLSGKPLAALERAA